MLVTTDLHLDRKKMLRWLEETQNAGSLAGCLYVPPATSLAEIERATGALVGAGRLPDRIPEMLASSPTGGSLFWGEHEGYLLLPPFPMAGPATAGNLNVAPMCQLLLKELTVGLLLLRLGTYAIGVFHDERLVASKVGSGNVHARHRQGGSSSHRFERHREKQIETFFTRVCGHAREKLEPYLGQLDWLIYGGTRETILQFRKQCDFVRKLDSRTLDRPLNVREPRQATLEAAIKDVWSTKVVHWKEE